MPNNLIDFSKVNNAAMARGESLLASWFPQGRWQAGEFCVGSLAGDAGDSLKINLEKGGVWTDFADSGAGGADLISLYAALHRLEQGEAARQLARELGLDPGGSVAPAAAKRRVVASYDYLNADGQLVFQVTRWEPKTFTQRRPDRKGGWINSVKDIALVPYRLPEVLKANTVYVPEGEKDVHALEKLGLTATCNAQGSGKWRAEYNGHFQGKTVVILPDNDEPGRKHAQDVAAQLHAVAASVKVLDLPGLPPKGDVSDWLAAGGTREGLLALAETTPMWEPVRVVTPEPRPLRRATCAGIPFPMDALGPILGPAARRVAGVVQAPMAMCAQSVLCAASLAVQAHFDVSVDGRTSPLSIFAVTIGESGERKSEVDRQALTPHRAFERELADEYSGQMRDYALDRDVWSKSKEQALTRGKTLREKQDALRELGPEPEAPLCPVILASDPTIEGVIKLLEKGQPSVGVFSDEGGRLIGGHAMNSDNLLRTMAGFCVLWDGAPIDRVRAGDGNSKLYGRRAALHLMAQPKVAHLLLGNGLAQDQGFLARCLVTWPESTAGSRFYKDVDLGRDADMRRYWLRMSDILHAQKPLAEGKRNELSPPALKLSCDAKQIWIKFHDHIEGQLGPEGEFASIRGFANKVPEHVLRVAGVLTAVEDLAAREIQSDKIESAILILQHYIAEALRIREASVVDEELVQAEMLILWAREQKKDFLPLVDAYQRGPNSIRDAKTARRLLGILEEHGHVVRAAGTVMIDGKPRREVWRIVQCKA